MNKRRGKRYNALLIILLATIAVYVSEAIAQDCSTIEKLRTHSDQNFRAIKKEPRGDFFTSGLVLPNASMCEIDEISPEQSTYTCEWLLVRGRERQNQAQATYKAMVDSWKLCVPDPSNIEIRQYKDERGEFKGERTRIGDPYHGMASYHDRYAEISFNFRNHWWTMTLNYGFYRGPAS